MDLNFYLHILKLLVRAMQNPKLSKIPSIKHFLCLKYMYMAKIHSWVKPVQCNLNITNLYITKAFLDITNDTCNTYIVRL